jgi:hypothetical protein
VNRKLGPVERSRRPSYAAEKDNPSCWPSFCLPQRCDACTRRLYGSWRLLTAAVGPKPDGMLVPREGLEPPRFPRHVLSVLCLPFHQRGKWSGQQDSNLRPPSSGLGALPTELHPEKPCNAMTLSMRADEATLKGLSSDGSPAGRRTHTGRAGNARRRRDRARQAESCGGRPAGPLNRWPSVRARFWLRPRLGRVTGSQFHLSRTPSISPARQKVYAARALLR